MPVQNSWLTITTGGALNSSSSGVKLRPRATVTPSSGK